MLSRGQGMILDSEVECPVFAQAMFQRAACRLADEEI